MKFCKDIKRESFSKICKMQKIESMICCLLEKYVKYLKKKLRAYSCKN
jgi:hypothetical protein